MEIALCKFWLHLPVLSPPLPSCGPLSADSEGQEEKKRNSTTQWCIHLFPRLSLNPRPTPNIWYTDLSDGGLIQKILRIDILPGCVYHARTLFQLPRYQTFFGWPKCLFNYQGHPICAPQEPFSDIMFVH